jgi:hypothetical protein
MRAAGRRPRRGRPGRRRKNPELLTISNPARQEMVAAIAAYKKFHGVAPKVARRFGKGKGILIALGDAKELVYRPTRGQRRGPAFFHRFGKHAVVVSNADGSVLRIVPARGSRLRVDWERGIVG